jgi:pyruvate dehydrogenase E2 component (dihydrolipoamide acetyltransferase)
MAQAVILPKLGQTMEEGAIVKWHKNVGDPVKKGDILFEIETDKAALEVESFFEGVLLKILIEANVTVPVNTVVGYVGEKGEKVPDAPPPPAQPAPAAAAPAPQAPVKTQAVSAPAAAPAAPAAAPKTASRPAAPAAPAAPRRLVISPRAKALASASVIDPAKIRGTGPGGRIVEKDVRSYLDAAGYANLRISPTAKTLADKEKIDILTVRGTGEQGRIRVEDVETALAERPKTMSKMRQVIARRLTESFTSTPHFYVTVAVDMTDLMKFRQELKARGLAYTVTDFILEAVIMSLKEYPGLNSSTDGITTTWHSKVNLGLAVSVAEGLVVPPIRNAEDLTLAELHDANQTLAAKARDGKLMPDEMTGSTFTVSNMGMMNVENFCAIINPGESAILAVSSTRDTPAVRDGKIVIRSIMKVTLSTDHRIVDGAMGAAFANAVKNKLEDMELWKRLTSL